jgi:hypothetical protein
MLKDIGEVTLEESHSAEVRRVLFRTDAPGYGLPVEATLEYRERYRRIARGWQRERYFYEYRRPSDGRIAYHDHPPLGLHQHCHEHDASQRTRHFIDHPRTLEETHERFAEIHLHRVPIDCGGLRPLT